jgi:hypothetical protein
MFVSSFSSSHKYATHLFSYRFNGREFTIDIVARDEAEAKERLKALAFARYDGELIARVPQSAGFLARLKVALRNLVPPSIR